jgi:hypothetical protein
VSDRPVSTKLLIKNGATLWVSPAARLELLGPLPNGVATATGPDDASVAVVFVDDAAAVRAMLDTDGARLGSPAVLWIAYPKGGRADINRDTLWPMFVALRLRPITQVSIDDTWSALRFRPLTPEESAAAGR